MPSLGRRGGYTSIIAAEYLASVVLIILSMGLVGTKASRTPAEVIASPAIAMVRLTAVSLLFFVLAILSTGQKIGRIAAAFGGLVTAGVALNSSEEWRSIARIFSPHKATS